MSLEPVPRTPKQIEQNRLDAIERLQRRRKEREAAERSAASQGNSRVVVRPPLSEALSPPSTSNNNTSAPHKVECSVISTSRFQAASRYNEQYLAVCRSFTTKDYDAVKKEWNFPITEYEIFHKKLQDSFGGRLEFSAIPEFVLSVCRKLSSTPPTPPIDLSPVSFLHKLFPYQKQAIETMISRGGRVLLADDMGLGKSIEALGVVDYYKAEGFPLLIVCPASMRSTWAESVKTWLNMREEDVTEVGSKKEDSNVTRTKVTIVGYETLSSRIDHFLTMKFNFLILDESHFVKNGKSQRSKNAYKLSQKIRRLLLLTGTPALSRPKELYNQITFLLGKRAFGGFMGFGRRYCEGKEGPWGFQADGASNLKELEVLLKSTIMIRREKREISTQLPAKQRKCVILDQSSVKTNLKELQKAKKDMELAKSTATRRSNFLQFYQQTAPAKKEAVMNYVMDILENGSKVIVFAHHQEMMDAISLKIGQKYRYIRIDGRTPTAERGKLVDQFQSEDAVKAAVLSIKAANTGLTLTQAALVIFAELTFLPGDLIQGEDRAHRVGQTETVTCHYLVARGTADDLLWPKLRNKLDTLTQAGLGGGESFGNADTRIISDSPFPNANENRLIDDFLETMMDPSESSVTGSSSETQITVPAGFFDDDELAAQPETLQTPDLTLPDGFFDDDELMEPPMKRPRGGSPDTTV